MTIHKIYYKVINYDSGTHTRRKINQTEQNPETNPHIQPNYDLWKR